MNLYETLQYELKTSRGTERAKHYQFILGEIQRDPKKDYSDQKILTVLKQMRKSMSEMIKFNPRDEKTLQLITIIDDILPSQLHHSDFQSIMVKYKFNNLGEFMKHLKDNFPNQYDGKVASQYFRENSNGCN